jgi:hypothetical protein
VGAAVGVVEAAWEVCSFVRLLFFLLLVNIFLTNDPYYPICIPLYYPICITPLYYLTSKENEMNLSFVMEQIDAYCNYIAQQSAEERTSPVQYVPAYKAAYKDCLEFVIDEARGTLL